MASHHAPGTQLPTPSRHAGPAVRASSTLH